MRVKLILASGSPRRKEILTAQGLEFEVVKSGCQEQTEFTEPGQVVCDLSMQKAKDVLAAVSDRNEAALILAADTIVYSRGRILGKPADEAEARAMVDEIQGESHKVYTGVSVVSVGIATPIEISFYECTEVNIYPMNTEEINDYISTGEPMDKAGAYGIQGLFAPYVKGINGDYNNVVGLPYARLYHELMPILSKYDLEL